MDANSNVRAQVAPANPAQVTDVAVRLAGDILMSHGLNAPEQVIYRAAREILETAAIGAGGQAVAVKVLDWVKHPLAEMWRCDTILGTYKVHVGSLGCGWQFDGITDRSDQPAANEQAAKAAAKADYERRILSALSQPHPADERVVEALRMAHIFIAREYRDEKSIALEGEFVSKEARPVFRALSDALSAKEGR